MKHEKRRRSRALSLRINARLEKAAAHGVVVNEAFIANLVLPENEAAREKIEPMAEALKTSAPTMPPASAPPEGPPA